MLKLVKVLGSTQEKGVWVKKNSYLCDAFSVTGMDKRVYIASAVAAARRVNNL